MSWAFEQTTPPVSKLVLLALADHADDNGVCWPGLLGLAGKTCLTRRTLLRHLNTLRRLGLVKVIPRHDHNGRQRSNFYHLPLASSGVGVNSDTPGCHQCHGEGATTVTGEDVTSDTQNRNIEPSDEPVAVAVGSEATGPCPHQKIIALYHEILPMCPRIKRWNENRRALLRARWQESGSLDYWKEFFGRVKRSDFLTGKVESVNGRTPFLADLEWLIKESNYIKVIEGKYDLRGDKKEGSIYELAN